VVNSLPENEVLMAPDRNLAQYTAAHTDKNIHYWDGCCPIHDRLTAEEARKARKDHPDAVLMAHPECRPEVLELADAVVSTSGMIRYAAESASREFIVGTENGLLHPLQKANPGKKFYPLSESMICPDMKKITLEDVARSLEYKEGVVEVPEEIRVPALAAVERMINL